MFISEKTFLNLTYDEYHFCFALSLFVWHISTMCFYCDYYYRYFTKNPSRTKCTPQCDISTGFHPNKKTCYPVKHCDLLFIDPDYLNLQIPQYVCNFCNKNFVRKLDYVHYHTTYDWFREELVLKRKLAHWSEWFNEQCFRPIIIHLLGRQKAGIYIYIHIYWYFHQIVERHANKLAHDWTCSHTCGNKRETKRRKEEWYIVQQHGWGHGKGN